jgi:hypothetical protein
LNRQNRFNSIIRADAAFMDGAFSAVSKNGKQVRSNPVMRNYRNLFEDEFGGNPRLFDITGSGLPLGVKTISVSEAFAILKEDQNLSPEKTKADQRAQGLREKLPAFVRREMDTLTTLKETLTGAVPLEPARLEALLDTAGYLWAHFPECAGASRRPPGTDLNFLKRVRVEIEPFMKLWEMSLAELKNSTKH